MNMKKVNMGLWNNVRFQNLTQLASTYIYWLNDFCGKGFNNTNLQELHLCGCAFLSIVYILRHWILFDHKVRLNYTPEVK